MAKNEGVRQTGEAIVVSTTPDVCNTPMGPNMVPVPYPILGKFDTVIRQKVTVRMTGLATITRGSRITMVTGDEAGVGGGVVSGKNLGYCKPIRYSTTVRVQGEEVVYNTSQMEMNCNGPDGTGNTIGNVVYIKAESFVSVTPSGEIEGDTNPPVEPETQEEKSWWQKASPWVHGALDIVGLIPGVGEVTDGINAVIYTAEGDYVSAGLSAAAMIPFAGWGATAGKFAKRGVSALVKKGAKEVGEEVAEKAVKRTTKEIIEGGTERATRGAVEEGTEQAAKKSGTDGVKITGRERRRRILKENRRKGKLREAEVEQELRDEGHEILGSQVTIKTPETRRVVDTLVRDGQTDQIRAIEVKSGDAVRSSSQIAKDNAMATQGGTIIGKNAPPELRGQTIKVPTEVRN